MEIGPSGPEFTFSRKSDSFRKCRRTFAHLLVLERDLPSLLAFGGQHFSTATTSTSPCDRCEGFYDLLTKDEIQASIGADKRTAVETLVAQDKLKDCQAYIRWVSSERQHADGMTKTEASQLWADRLRTQGTKLISDDSFQASKKKSPQQRKQAAEMFATKRTSKALTALAMQPPLPLQQQQTTALCNMQTTNALVRFFTILGSMVWHYYLHFHNTLFTTPTSSPTTFNTSTTTCATGSVDQIDLNLNKKRTCSYRSRRLSRRKTLSPTMTWKS